MMVIKECAGTTEAPKGEKDYYYYYYYYIITSISREGDAYT